MQLSRTILPSLIAALALGMASCSGGGSTPGTTPGTSGDFLVQKTDPPNNGQIFLNDPIIIEFSNAVDPDSLRLDALDIRVFDLNNNPLTEIVFGSLSVESTGPVGPNGPDNKRVVLTPRFPTNETFDNGSFRPGRKYVINVVGGEQGFRDAFGQPIRAPFTFLFSTVEGALPGQLFRDVGFGGPVPSSFDVSPKAGGAEVDTVALNRFGTTPVEIRLGFNQPLNPQLENLPLDLSLDPLLREGVSKGRVFLEYDDLPNTDIWIPATVDLEVNTNAGSELVLRPIGLLPNNANIRVIYEKELEDLSGQSNEFNPLFDRIFARFETTQEFEPQFDALVEAFDLEGTVDSAAPFLEPEAAIKDGSLQSTFSFEGIDARFEYEPTVREVELNTDFTQVTPKGAPPINVAGGVFRFAKVTIPEGVEVKGVGSNPMVWLVNGDFTINGTLTVDGGDGTKVSGLAAANIPTGGGVGNAGGGSGGLGSPNPFGPSLRGEAGRGPGNRPNGGGAGGRYACIGGAVTGSGGGGGSFTTQGDPNIPPDREVDIIELVGEGGAGVINMVRTPRGGEAGPLAFKDSRDDNNFWGSGVDLSRQIRIRGELIEPISGSGGGGGGDMSRISCNPGTNYVQNARGGGGGGGAGAIVIQALGKIIIGPEGAVRADGGLGGGGEAAGSNTDGGGGGGGSGGMIVLMAGQGMDIFVHTATNPFNRATYGELDYKFAISADGGICTQGNFGQSQIITDKYPPLTAAWDATPIGGFGGMGLVQLMMPPGQDTDGTGNRLDDRIRFFVKLAATNEIIEVDANRKKQMLAWRGWPDGNGIFVDDNGDPTNIGKNEGDIRPSPIMLPAPFGALSRARSRWIDLGLADRDPQAVAPGPGVPGVVVTTETPPSPDFEFAGTSTVDGSGMPSTYLGYGDYTDNAQIQFKAAPGLDTPIDVLSTGQVSDFRGGPAYVLTLPAASLPAEQDRYAHYRAQLLNSTGGDLGDIRILGHDDSTVYLETNTVLPSDLARIRVLAKFFDVSTNGSPGLGSTSTIPGDPPPPEANVRVGFAFHTDPASSSGIRFPSDPTAFAFDLQDPALLNFLRSQRPTYVQWDVLFNARFHPNAADNASGMALSAEMSLPTLEYLVLPFRF
ncbi:MAG: Ig-like domain-containing domain [Planctomycetota bacterium]|jgi:hypothetical protein